MSREACGAVRVSRSDRVLFVVNVPEFFLSHRSPLAVAVRDAGLDVYVATGPGWGCERIAELGFVYFVLPLSRSGRNPFHEARSLWELFLLMRRLKPDLVHLVSIKPVLYGGMAARLAGVPAVVVAISGLGTVFSAREGRGAWLRRGVEVLYRLALGHRNLGAVFQNSDDRAVLMSMEAVREEQTTLIRGSGVALADYPMRPEPEGVPTVTFVGRLLKDKGVVEFVEASKILRARGISARFWLVGAPDPGNPSSVTEDEVAHWGEEGSVEPLGYRTDIAELLAQSNIVAFPSYYGEGLPKVLIEAAACGRAVVTTDHPGCRDAIEPGKTGLLVPVRDAVAFADGIQTLIEDPAKRGRMGEAGRVLAESTFAVESVVDAHLKLYRKLLPPEHSCEA